MFSFLKKEPHEAESIEYCRKLARRAYLDIAYQAGKAKFLVQLDTTGKVLAPYMKHRVATASFIEEIELRISREFPSSPAEDLGLPAELMTHTKDDFKFCYRVVGSSEMKGLFKWRYTSDSELSVENV